MKTTQTENNTAIKNQKDERLSLRGEAPQKHVEKRKNVKVAEFRSEIEHLEHVFNVDRHSCVGDNEKLTWRIICKRVLDDLLLLTCKRAKPNDLENRNLIVQRVQEYLK